MGRQEAEDAVSDAMFSLWRRWPTLLPGQRTDPYIFAAVKLKALTTMNRNRRTVEFDEAAEVLDEQAVAVFEAGSRYDDISGALDSAISSMPTRRREVILLVYEQRFTSETHAAWICERSLARSPERPPGRRRRRSASRPRGSTN